ncbi:MAG: hypothetical protein JW932_09320 [Deltaproteobacteria bacterium]|nr:hypothetical protein [Deltaproteobacteria bacterium]
MNIFILDRNINRCARYHCDQHVIKMILEGVQILCTALNKKGMSTPYKSTHPKHPCVLWVEHSYENFIWLKNLTLALNDEYKYRFENTKDHRSIFILSKILSYQYENIGLTEFVQAMPEKYKVPNEPVKAYRRYYLGEKMYFAKWTRRLIPYWVRNPNNL